MANPTQAQIFAALPTTDETLQKIGDAAVEIDQDWDNETTTWTFSDGSKMQLCDFTMDVL